MPAKSKHGKGKYAHQARKQEQLPQPSPGAPQTTLARGAPAPAGAAAAPRPASIAAPTVKATAEKSRIALTELRNIGILVAIMAVILVVLARVLA